MQDRFLTNKRLREQSLGLTFRLDGREISNTCTVVYTFTHLDIRNFMLFQFTIIIGNSTVSRGIWDKYREWYFKIHQNITSRRGEWYLGSFEISRAGIYPKYHEETVLFFVYTTRQRNIALYVTHIFLFSHVQLIGFTTLFTEEASFPFEYFATVDKLSVLGNGNVAACFLEMTVLASYHCPQTVWLVVRTNLLSYLGEKPVKLPVKFLGFVAYNIRTVSFSFSPCGPNSIR